MRIGIDASRAFVDSPTGTETYSYQVIRHILALPEARKHEWILYVKRISPSLIPPLKSSLRLASYAVRRGQGVILKEIPLSILWTQAGLAGRTCVDRLEVLWVPAHTLPVLRKPGLKTVVTIHGIEYEWLPEYENVLQKWYLPWSTIYAVRSATKVVAVSGFTKKQLVERLGADPGKIEVVHEGVETKIQKAKIKSVLKKYSLEEGKYLLFVGTIQPRKNLERLVEAFAVLCNAPSDPPLKSSLRLASYAVRGGRGGYEDFRLVIAGKWGWRVVGVRGAPVKYGVEDRVVFTGYVGVIEREVLLRSCLAYVQPSITEGFGLPVLEAMAARVPVVSSRGGALEEVTGAAGMLFNPYDVKEMVECLREVVESEGLRRELVKRGRERVKDFSWEKAARQTMKIIASL